MADSWGGVAQLVNNTVGTTSSGVSVTATTTSVTVTNGTAQGAISVIIISGTHVTAL